MIVGDGIISLDNTQGYNLIYSLPSFWIPVNNAESKTSDSTQHKALHQRMNA